jgi:Cytochrome P460
MAITFRHAKSSSMLGSALKLKCKSRLNPSTVSFHRKRTKGQLMPISARIRIVSGKQLVAVAIIAVVLPTFASIALAVQDKYSVKDPKGLAFSDFRGYEGWQVVSVSQTPDLLKVMVANPTMIDAYKNGIPGNGKPFPDGSRIAKIEYKFKKSSEAPFEVNVPDALQDVFFIEKDSERFPTTSGWGYAAFDYNAASDTFAPNKDSIVNCGYACHTIVKATDYIFHSYQKR